MTPHRRTTFDHRVRRTAVVGLTVCVAVLVAGLTLAFVGADVARPVLVVGLGGLVVLPIVTVVAAFVEEVRRGDWPFAAAALAVLGILAYNIYPLFR